ncbi:MAG: diguanylate cyclase, partial [Peptococcaceae bacterium]|nr:diguanylate cyclase [Peptococcaceae bacterium]
MLKVIDPDQAELLRHLNEGHPVWLIYLDIYKFHELEFRYGLKACKQVLLEIELEINHALRQNSESFLLSCCEFRGGDDFVVYLVPNAKTIWSLQTLASDWVKGLEKRINTRLNTWLEEAIRLNSGLVQCMSEPGRSSQYLLYAAVKEAFLISKAEPDPQYFSRREEINRLILHPEQYLRSAFQPILRLKDASIFGYEALARLTETTCFPYVGEIFPFAEKIGLLYPIETLCRRTAITSAEAVLKQDE